MRDEVARWRPESAPVVSLLAVGALILASGRVSGYTPASPQVAAAVDRAMGFLTAEKPRDPNDLYADQVGVTPQYLRYEPPATAGGS